MVHAFVDAWPTLISVFGLAAALVAIAWWRTRKRSYVKLLAILAALAVMVTLPRFWVETPRQEIDRKLHEMADAVSRGDLNGAFAHISDRFQVAGINKSEFRGKAQDLIDRFGVTKMIVWDIEIIEMDQEKGTASASLAVKTFGNFRGSGDLFYHARAEFIRDSDGQWRLQSFQIFHPFIDSTTPLPLPL